MIVDKPAGRPPEAQAIDLSPPPVRVGPVPRVVSHLARLVLLACAGCVMQIAWMIVWTLSYRLTHGNDFTYDYLVNHPAVWEKLYDLLNLANRLAPGIETPDGPASLDLIVNGLVWAFIIAGLAYLAGILLVDLGVSAVPGAFGVVLLFETLYQATLFLLPGLYTTDLFSYVMYGHISAIYKLNPYIYPPSYFPGNPLLDWIHPIWHDQPSVYGPLWTDLGWLMAKVTQPLSLADHVFAYKVLMNAAQAANVVLIWWLLGRLFPRSRRARLTAFTVFAWNPLMLFDVAGNAHNDALMVTLLLLGVVPLVLGGQSITSRRWFAGVVLVGLSALIKFTTGLVGLFYVVPWARRLGSWPARVAWIGGAGLAVGVLTFVLFLPWLEPAALGPILEAAAGGKSWQHNNSLPDIAAVLIDEKIVNGSRVDPAWLADDAPHTYGNLYETPTTDATRGRMKLAMRGIFGVYLLWECWRLWRTAADASRSLVDAVLAASVRAFLVLLLLVLTWVLEWYFFWPLALATLLGWHRMLTKVTVAYTLTSLPVFYVHHYWSWHMSAEVELLYVVPPLLLPLIGWAWQLVRRRVSYQVSVPALEGSSVAPPAAVRSGPGLGLE